jgi:hypothetical protein
MGRAVALVFLLAAAVGCFLHSLSAVTSTQLPHGLLRVLFRHLVMISPVWPCSGIGVSGVGFCGSKADPDDLFKAGVHR